MFRFLCELFLSCSAAVGEPLSVEELTYRSALFDYYQQDYPAALVDVLVAERQGRIGNERVKFDLARGSLAFEQGMVDYALKVFDSVPAQALTDLDRLRLDFHLARLYHRQQNWDRLETVLTELEAAQSALKTDMHPEVAFMHADLLTRRGEYARAGAIIDGISDSEPYRAYALYNFGVALRDAGHGAEAADVFRVLEGMPGNAQEVRDLRQRGRLARAYLSRDAQALEDARTILDDLPGSSRYRDSALATYGSLAMDQKDYELAARIWLTLRQQGGWQPSISLARLGFPMALQGMSEPGLVLAHFQTSEREYEQHLLDLTTVRRQSADAAWVNRLMRALASSGSVEAGLADLTREAGDLLGRDEWLGWLSAGDVQTLVDEWRTLHEMAQWLGSVPDTLDIYEQVSRRQAERAQELSHALADSGVLDQATAMRDERNRLTDRAAALDSAPPTMDESWMLSVATDEEAASIRRLLAMREELTSSPPAQAGALLDRVNRLLGALFFQLADDYPNRRWQLVRQGQDLDESLAEVDASVGRVRRAAAEHREGVEADLAEYRARAALLSERVNAAIHDREIALGDLLQQHMAEQAKRIEQYLFMTRVAIAQASDQLAMAEDSR